jgi:hypothetical protein
MHQHRPRIWLAKLSSCEQLSWAFKTKDSQSTKLVSQKHLSISWLNIKSLEINLSQYFFFVGRQRTEKENAPLLEDLQIKEEPL